MAVKGSLAVIFIVIFLIFSTVALSPVYSANQNTWTVKSSMPVTRLPGAMVGAQAAVVEGKIYLMGIYLMDHSAVNYQYDPSTDNWTPMTTLSNLTAGSGMGIAAYQNKIYTFNGSSVNVYDPENHTWETRQPAPVSDRWGANVVGDRIYLIGGNGHFQIYNPENDSWSAFTASPYPIGISTVCANKIYVFADNSSKGGYAGLTEIYDSVNDSWTLGAPPPQLVSGATAAATTGINSLQRVYLIGGQDGLTGTNNNQIYNPKTDSWINGTVMPSVRMGPAIAVVNDVLYVFDGWANIELVSNANEQFYPLGYGSPDPSYDATPPEIAVLSPENITYHTVDVALNFTVNETVSSMSYMLDGEVFDVSENTTLAGLAYGSHNLTVYATDAADNRGSSETVNFNVAKEPEPFPVMPVVAASIILVVVVGIGLLVYFKKRKH